MLGIWLLVWLKTPKLLQVNTHAAFKTDKTPQKRTSFCWFWPQQEPLKTAITILKHTGMGMGWDENGKGRDGMKMGWIQILFPSPSALRRGKDLDVLPAPRRPPRRLRGGTRRPRRSEGPRGKAAGDGGRVSDGWIWRPAAFVGGSGKFIKKKNECLPFGKEERGKGIQEGLFVILFCLDFAGLFVALLVWCLVFPIGLFFMVFLYVFLTRSVTSKECGDPFPYPTDSQKHCCIWRSKRPPVDVPLSAYLETWINIFVFCWVLVSPHN